MRTIVALLIVGMSIVIFTSAAAITLEEFVQQLEAQKAAHTVLIKNAQTHRAAACPILKDSRDNGVCDSLFEVVILRRQSEKLLIEANILAFKTGSDKTRSDVMAIAPMSHYNATILITNQMWDAAILVYPMPSSPTGR